MKSIRTLLLLLLVQGLVVSVFGQDEKVVRPGEPDIYSVESDDKEMNTAITKSRSSFNEFDAAFESKNTAYSGFSVKMPFATEYGAEHIWLTDIKKNDGKYYGRIDNLPADVRTVKLGQVIEIESSKISDWFYVNNGKLVGGQTVRLIRSRMSSKERKKFDSQLGFKIE